MKRYIRAATQIDVPKLEYDKMLVRDKISLIDEDADQLSLSTLKLLATDKSPRVRAELANIITRSDGILPEQIRDILADILARDPSSDVKLRLYWGKNRPKFSDDALIELAKDKDAFNLKMLAKLYGDILPESALRALATTANSKKGSIYNEGKDVRAYIANNPRTPEDVLMSLASTDTSLTVAEALTQNKALTPEVMEYIITDGTPIMKRCLADAEYVFHILPDDLRDMLYNSGSKYIKRVLDGKDENMNYHAAKYAEEIEPNG